MITCNHLLLGGGKINNLKKVGKAFLSQLLSICAIFGTASCNDDQVFNQTDTAPLQVSVNAQGTQSSRAIIHGEYLPDGSSIGISLFTPDGADYDNQGYFNVKYTASSEGESQSWAAQGTTPSISANPANLLAYYPWSDNQDLDLTAIPVENVSQTDYMYAHPVTGVTNANPKVNIIMKHALTAIRVNLVLGNYTGDAAVSEISVKSPGLAAAATLNVYNGELDNISGQGDEFALTTEFELSAAGTATDVLFVPDASVTEGSTTVSATIGGKKYTASISFDEAYLQGYIYTYTLTLNNSGFEVTKVSVNPWKDGTDKEAELEVYKDIEVDKTEHSTSKLGEQIKFTITAKNSWTASTDQSWCTLNVTSGEPGVTTVLATVDENMLEQARFATITVTTENYSVPVVIYQKSELEDEYIVKVLINNDNMPYQHNIKDFVGTIDWGDGTIDTYTTESTWPEHTYAKAGTYTVMAKDTANAISMIEGDIISGNVIVAVETPYIKELVSIGSDMGITSMNCAFATHTMLDNIYPDAISGLKAQNFTMVFGMTGLKTVPQGLFDKCTEATNFYGAFAECNNLQSIPKGLFYNCKEVTSLSMAFAMTGITEIPSYTFGTEAAEVDLTDIFLNTNIFAIKSNAFNCPNLTSLAGLFKNNYSLFLIEKDAFNCPSVTSFKETFYNTRITNIPEGLFDKCTNVTDFGGAFQECINLTSIPEGLFDKCTEVTDFSYTFRDCNGLTEIPSGLFDYNTKVTTFGYTFYKCKKLQSIPKRLFDSNIEVTDFSDAFGFCSSLQSIPIGLFDKCTKVTDFSSAFYGTGITSIPTGLFDKCTKVTDFGGAFGGTNISNIPEGLFDACTEVTNFNQTFYFCESLQAIPEGLFDACTKVTSFGQTFANSTNLTTIPEGLFDKCTEVTNFHQTFWRCHNLQEIPSNTFGTEAAGVDFTEIFHYCNALTIIKSNAFNCPNLTSLAGLFKNITSLTTVEKDAFNCPSVTSFKETFYNTRITNIPEGLFDKCTKVTDFSGTFYGCTGLEGESPYTMVNGVKVHLYERSSYPEYFTAPTIFTNCFDSCTGLTDYSIIPTTWK